jgi:hypothetical protein
MKTSNEMVYDIIAKARMDADIKRLKDYVAKHPKYQKKTEETPQGDYQSNRI